MTEDNSYNAITEFQNSMRAPKAPQVPKKPMRSLDRLVKCFQSVHACAVMRKSVLELTHIELKLFAECAFIETDIQQRGIDVPPVPLVPNYVNMLEYYEAALNDWLRETELLFDETQRLMQPWYRDSLTTDRIVRLENRGTPAASAFALLEALRLEARPRSR